MRNGAEAKPCLPAAALGLRRRLGRRFRRPCSWRSRDCLGGGFDPHFVATAVVYGIRRAIADRPAPLPKRRGRISTAASWQRCDDLIRVGFPTQQACGGCRLSIGLLLSLQFI